MEYKYKLTQLVLGEVLWGIYVICIAITAAIKDILLQDPLQCVKVCNESLHIFEMMGQICNPRGGKWENMIPGTKRSRVAA